VRVRRHRVRGRCPVASLGCTDTPALCAMESRGRRSSSPEPPWRASMHRSQWSSDRSRCVPPSSSTRCLRCGLRACARRRSASELFCRLPRGTVSRRPDGLARRSNEPCPTQRSWWHSQCSSRLERSACTARYAMTEISEEPATNRTKPNPTLSLPLTIRTPD